LHIPIYHIFPFLEIKLLEVDKRRGAEPGVHGGRTVLEKVWQDPEAVVGAQVGGEDEGDHSCEGLDGGSKLLSIMVVGLGLGVEVCAVKDER